MAAEPTPGTSGQNDDIDSLSYEDAREQLVGVVGRWRQAAPAWRNHWRCGSGARPWPSAAKNGLRVPGSAWLRPRNQAGKGN